MSSFECLVVKINGNSPVLIIIYRPPKVNSVFFSELAELLTLLSSNCSDILLVGDIMSISRLINLDTHWIWSAQLG